MEGSKKQQSGFSLVEILVTIMIVGILAGIGGFTYRKYNKLAEVKSAAKRTAGYLIEAQSLAEGSEASQLVGYQVYIDENIVKLLELTYENDEFKKELVSNKEIDLAGRNEVKLDKVELLNSRYNPVSSNIKTITAVSPNGRLLFNNREPDLNQSESLYNPFPEINPGEVSSYLPYQNGGARARIVFSTQDGKYKYRVLIDGVSGKINAEGGEDN